MPTAPTAAPSAQKGKSPSMSAHLKHPSEQCWSFLPAALEGPCPPWKEGTELLVNKNKTQNVFLNQNLELLAADSHLKLLELKAQQSFRIFIPHKCSMIVAFQCHMGLFSVESWRESCLCIIKIIIQLYQNHDFMLRG